MQKWEYHWLAVGAHPKDEIKVGDQTVSVANHLADLGERGWELVSVTPLAEWKFGLPNGTTTRLVYWLKRPKT